MATRKKTAGNTRTAAEIQEKIQGDMRFDEMMFKKTQEMLLKIKDPNRNDIQSIIGKDRKNIRQYLQNPASNENNLITSARYLYYRTQIFFRLVNFYADMFDFRCRQVIPNYTLTKANKPNKPRSPKSVNAALRVRRPPEERRRFSAPPTDWKWRPHSLSPPSDGYRTCCNTCLIFHNAQCIIICSHCKWYYRLMP